MKQIRQINRFFAVLTLTAINAIVIPATCQGQGYTITTVAGGGSGPGYGDGGQATSAVLREPTGAAVDAAGNLYIADSFNAVWKVAPNGIISTVAGSYQAPGFSGDGGPATEASLFSPTGLAVDGAGNLYIADLGNNRVRKVSPDGTITTVAGGGSPASGNGDGGPAISAKLSAPGGIAFDASGNMYISEGGLGGSRIRRVSPNGTISTIAGNGTLSFSGDNGPASSAALNVPLGIAVDAAGNLYIADGGNCRIRKVSASGIITTVAGNGAVSFSGDGGPATSAGFEATWVAVDSAGNLYIVDGGNERVRLVNTSGIITTIAGNGVLGTSGDGGPATSAELNVPFGIALGAGGKVYVTDGGGGRVRMLTPSASSGSSPSIASGGIVSAGAFGAFTSVAPGSWIEIYGTNVAADSRLWSGADFTGVNAPTSLDGTSVTVGGQSAFVSYISPNQVNVQVPSNVNTGSQPIIVTTASGASAAYTITVNAQQPGLLAPNSFIIGGKQYIAAFFQDGAFALPPGAIAGVSSRRAQPGDILTLWGIGFGPTTPNTPAGQLVPQLNTLAAPFHMLFGQTEATLQYDGLEPNAVGLYQFNVVVPNVASSDAVPLTFTLGGVAGTQTLYIAVQNGALATQVQSLTLSASSVTAGGSVLGTVLLTASAPAGGAVVLLSSNSTAASVPATVTVPAGSTSATFTVSTTTVGANQTATLTASYSGSSAQATLTVTPPSPPPFLTLSAAPLLFQPVGFASGNIGLSLALNADNTTYTATIGGSPTFTNGTFSAQGQTFTANVLQPSTISPPYGLFVAPGTNFYLISGASLTFTLAPKLAGFPTGNLSGTLSVTGTPYPGGGAPVTLSGAISGSYVATLGH